MSEFRLPDPAEIEKLRAEWRREQRGAEVEHNNRRAELLTMRSKLHLAQQRLEQEVRARRSDAVQASGRVMVAERQLAEARLTLEIRNKTEARKNKVRFSMSAGTAAAAVIVAIVGWTQGRRPINDPPSTLNAKAPIAGAITGAQPGKELAHSPNRLVPSNQGNNRAAPCRIQWNGGQPALIYSGGSTGNSLSATLEHCAEAVEQYRPATSSK